MLHTVDEGRRKPKSKMQEQPHAMLRENRYTRLLLC